MSSIEATYNSAEAISTWQNDSEKLLLNIPALSNLEIVKDDSPVEKKILLQKGAQLDLHLINRGTHAQNINIEVLADAQLSLFIYNLSPTNFSNSFELDLVEKNASCELFVLEICHKESMVNNHIHIRHGSEHTNSKQELRGIYAHKARGAMQAKVLIEKNASKAKALQSYKALILDTESSAQIKPELEINNNDVSAKHGASIGELDKNMLFYLCSRGLSIKEAKELLIAGFAKNFLGEIKNIEIKNKIEAYINESIQGSLGDQHG